jgi:hypothetical protein
MKSVGIYQRTPDGMLRLGTFRPRKHYSIRAISEQFMRQHPNADPSELYISTRRYIMGKFVDWETGKDLIPFDMTQESKL